MATTETGGGALKPPRKRSAGQRDVQTQPLSAKMYAAFAGVGLVFAAALAVLLVQLGPKLNAMAQGNLVFYVLLIPCSLACAAFLFGSMRSYAHWTGKAMNGKLELTGPVVVFCVVMYGGYKLLPQAASAFDLKVRAVAANAAPVAGRIKLLASDLNGELERNIDSDGYARFEKLPSQLKRATVRLVAEADGFSRDPVAVPLNNSDIVDLPLKESHSDVTVSFMPPPGKTAVWVKVVDKDNNSQSGNVDANGNAKFTVSGEAGDTVGISVYCHGVDGAAVDKQYVIGNDISIDLTGTRCGGK